MIPCLGEAKKSLKIPVKGSLQPRYGQDKTNPNITEFLV